MVSNYRAVGKTQLPLSSSFNNTIRTVADPTQDTITRYVEAVLTAELGDAMAEISKSVEGLDGYVVKTKIDFDPSFLLVSEMQLKLPLLAVYESADAVFSDWTIDERQVDRTWRIEYILPEVSLFEKIRVHSFLHAVRVAITTALDDNCHPAFNDGYTVFDANYVAVETASSARGLWQININEQSLIEFPTVAVIAQSNELVTRDNSNETDLDGFDVEIYGDGYSPAGVIDGYLLHEATINL